MVRGENERLREEQQEEENEKVKEEEEKENVKEDEMTKFQDKEQTCQKTTENRGTEG